MADESDVAQALVDLVASVLYPNGSTQPSIVGPARIYRGWPQAANLDKDLAARVLNVSIDSRDGMSRNTTRYLEQDLDASPNAPSIGGQILRQTVTFTGTAVVGDVVGLSIRHVGYAYAIQPGDSLNEVAAHFAAALHGTSQGPAVTLQSGADIAFAAVSMGQSAREVRRTDQGFTITIWAFDYPSRDAAASAIDAKLADTPWLALPDGSSARLRFAQTLSSDKAENANLYRRDLIYHAEYPTLAINAAFRALFIGATVTRVIGGSVTPTPDAIFGDLYPT